MNDTTDHAAISRDLALLCCRLRGLDPDHVAPGQTDPLWKSPRIMDVVNVVVRMLGSEEAARAHLETAANA